MTKKKSIMLILATLCFVLSAQNAKLLFRTTPALEWSLFSAIAHGELFPTAIHSLTQQEAKSLGAPVENASGALSQKNFAQAQIIVNPFILGWSGFDTKRYEGQEESSAEAHKKDPSYRNRFSLDYPVLSLGFNFGTENFYGTTAIDFNTDSASHHSTQEKPQGIIGFKDYLAIFSYMIFPERGYLSYANDTITLAAGRFPTGIGFGDTNIFLNGQSSYDHIEFSFKTSHFRFFSLMGSSASHLNKAETWIQNFEGLEPNKGYGWDYINNHDSSTQTLVPLKLYTYHRIEWQFFNTLGIGISEMQLMGGKAPELVNLFPTMYWHNTYTAGISNVMILADAWVQPLPGLMIFGEFLMDDSKAPSEIEMSKPNCWGWSFGAYYVPPIQLLEYRLALTAEYHHVDRWTYNRWQPWLTMYQREVATGGHYGFDSPLGHPAGGDVDSTKLRLIALSKKRARFELGYEYIAKGPVYLSRYWEGTGKVDGEEQTIYIPLYYDFDWWYKKFDVQGNETLESLIGSTVKHSHVLTAKVLYPFAQHFECNAGVDYRYIINAEHTKGKTAHEIVWKAGVAWKY